MWSRRWSAAAVTSVLLAPSLPTITLPSPSDTLYSLYAGSGADSPVGLSARVSAPRLNDQSNSAGSSPVARKGDPMTSAYDAIVVGGGHNGLVSAAYLARSGARTVVLEGRYKTGGASTTETPWPDAPEFKVTRLSYVMSLMPPTIINDLKLASRSEEHTS